MLSRIINMMLLMDTSMGYGQLDVRAQAIDFLGEPHSSDETVKKQAVDKFLIGDVVVNFIWAIS